MTDEEFEKLKSLCRIACSEEEKRELSARLTRVLKYIDQLKEVSSEEVSPCNHVSETFENVLRDDVVSDTLPRETFLANAPAHVGGMIRVPPVIKGY